VDGKEADSVFTGEAAHIEGENSTAARFNPSMTDAQRDGYENLIYLCGNCHTKIDKQVKDYSVELLKRIKNDHELTVRQALAEAFSSIGFPELEEATQWIIRIQPNVEQRDFSLITPEEKIKKNDLGANSKAVIVMGLSVASEVQKYLESVSQSDSEFPDRLKTGFLTEYYRLRKDGFGGDELFEFMCRFAQRGFKEQAKKSAGLAVLVYLFDSCEVFEK
jgi:hypothetical protein